MCWSIKVPKYQRDSNDLLSYLYPDGRSINPDLSWAVQVIISSFQCYSRPLKTANTWNHTQVEVEWYKSILCKNTFLFVQATPEDHVKVTQEQYELYCEMGSTFQVRLWRGEIVILLRKKFLNWWNSHLPPNRQQRGYDATEQFSLFIDKFCHVENFFIRCRAMCAFCTHFSETTIYCGLD